MSEPYIWDGRGSVSAVSAREHVHDRNGFCLKNRTGPRCPNPDEGPDRGHTFRISVRSRGAGKVVGEEHNTDSNWWGEPYVQDVRAWNLPEAMRRAAERPMGAWETADHAGEAFRAVLREQMPSGTAELVEQIFNGWVQDLLAHHGDKPVDIVLGSAAIQSLFTGEVHQLLLQDSREEDSDG